MNVFKTMNNLTTIALSIHVDVRSSSSSSDDHSSRRSSNELFASSKSRRKAKYSASDSALPCDGHEREKFPQNIRAVKYTHE